MGCELNGFCVIRNGRVEFPLLAESIAASVVRLRPLGLKLDGPRVLGNRLIDLSLARKGDTTVIVGFDLTRLWIDGPGGNGSGSVDVLDPAIRIALTNHLLR